MHKFDRKRGKSEGDLYIEGYPRLSKWINECKCCHRRGYKPDLPEQIGVVEGNLASYHIKNTINRFRLTRTAIARFVASLLSN